MTNHPASADSDRFTWGPDQLEVVGHESDADRETEKAKRAARELEEAHKKRLERRRRH